MVHRRILDIYEDDSLGMDWSEKVAKEVTLLVERIRNAAQDSEKIRIWWSNSAEEKVIQNFMETSAVVQNGSSTTEVSILARKGRTPEENECRRKIPTNVIFIQ